MANDHPLPSNLIPAGDICVPLFIPDDPDYVALLVRAIRILDNTRHYEQDAGHSAKIVSDQWSTRTITPLIEALAKGQHCGGCMTWWPFHPNIEFFPNDPYTEPDLVTEGYLFPAWYIADTAAEVIFDATKPAATTTLERLPPGSLPTILPASGLPRFRINVNGTGTVEIHLTALNAGGLMQVQVDNDLLQMDWVDTNQDKIAIPPETENIIIIEREFTTPGPHHIDCTVIPTLDDAIIPLLYGGGLLKVEVCGFTPQFPGTGDDLDGLQMRLTALCGMEFSTDGGTLWQPVTDWDTNAMACFLGDAGAAGLDGTDGIDGTDGVDGEDGQTANEFPPLPTPAEPDELCGASYKIATELEAYVQQTIIDIGIITLEAFLDSLLSLGGYDGDMLQVFWDFLVATIDPTLSAEVALALDAVAEHFYCNELDIAAAQTAINADASLTVNARGAYNSAINSLSDGKFALWAFVGSQDDTQDCSSFACNEWSNVHDYTIAAYEIVPDTPPPQGEWTGSYWKDSDFDNGLNLDAILTLDLTFPFDVDLTRVIVDYAQITGVGGYVRKVLLFDVLDVKITEWILSGSVGRFVLDNSGTWDSVRRLRIVIQDADPAKEFRVHKLTYHGTGANPNYGVTP